MPCNLPTASPNRTHRHLVSAVLLLLLVPSVEGSSGTLLLVLGTAALHEVAAVSVRNLHLLHRFGGPKTQADVRAPLSLAEFAQLNQDLERNEREGSGSFSLREANLLRMLPGTDEVSSAFKDVAVLSADSVTSGVADASAAASTVADSVTSGASAAASTVADSVTSGVADASSAASTVADKTASTVGRAAAEISSLFSDESVRVVNYLHAHDGPPLPEMYLERPPDPALVEGYTRPKTWGEANVTVVLMAFKNQENILAQACHYATMKNLVSEVLLVWNNPNLALDMLRAPCSGPALAVIRPLSMQHNTLLNRYNIYNHVSTEAVLLLDDDVMISSEHELKEIYNLWADHPRQVTGIWPRCIRKRHDEIQDDGSPTWKYGWDVHQQWWRWDFIDPIMIWFTRVFEDATCGITYQLTIGRANMVHRNYLQLFMARQPKAIMEHIFQSHPTCEDIALHFVVSNQTGLPPVVPDDEVNWLDAPRDGVGRHEGMSVTAGWADERSACVNEFARIYGEMPLKEKKRTGGSSVGYWLFVLTTLLAAGSCCCCVGMRFRRH
eukprot:gnl/TRDRNA2_/TRDRNA2_37794_c0_seq1.p1 gnl/TRDRNA2_/TRDRNA2_37794_c0~~gnl/TRDRNA2_/TRDRNA2_37794_c0_seq1.p1  ORF type:complete len:555 (-),score=74.95 gnl/TRDRNA2_/TRDRNA2_37794_c0_seq1:65-1729(-)